MSQGANEDQDLRKPVPFLLNAPLLRRDSFLFSDLLMAPGVLLSFYLFPGNQPAQIQAVPNQGASGLGKVEPQSKDTSLGAPEREEGEDTFPAPAGQ